MKILVRKSNNDVIAFNSEAQDTTEIICREIPDREIPRMRADFFTFTGTDAVEKSQADKDALLASDVMAETASVRDAAKKRLVQKSPEGSSLRAAILVFLDELNLLRAQLSMAPLSANAIKQKIKDKLDAGLADS